MNGYHIEIFYSEGGDGLLDGFADLCGIGGLFVVG